MSLSPQALRRWKLGTYIATGLTAFQLVFRTDYGPHDHVLSNVQRWYRRAIDRVVLGIDADGSGIAGGNDGPDSAGGNDDDDGLSSLSSLEPTTVVAANDATAENRSSSSPSSTWKVGPTGARGDAALGSAAVDKMRRIGRERVDERDKKQWRGESDSTLLANVAKKEEKEEMDVYDENFPQQQPLPGLRWRKKFNGRSMIKSTESEMVPKTGTEKAMPQPMTPLQTVSEHDNGTNKEEKGKGRSWWKWLRGR